MKTNLSSTVFHFPLLGITNWTSGEIFTECGGVLNLNEDLPTLTITTPDYPLLTGAFHSCAWVIR